MLFPKKSFFYLRLTQLCMLIFVLLLLSLLSIPVNAQDSDKQSSDKTVKYISKEEYEENFPAPPVEHLIHNGIPREYILYLPASYDGKSKMPLLLNFHGYGGMARYHYYTADMRSVAEAGQFMLVYPQGTLLDSIEGQAHWNAGLDTPENKSDADDFGFINALIDKLSATYLIDEDRIYAIGYSNGGYFSYALACYYSDRIAAIASVSGTMLLETHGHCDPSHPTGMLNIHGTKDSVVPYHYKNNDNLASIEAVLEYWAEFNADDNSTLEPTITSESLVEHHAYHNSNGQTFVEHYKVIDGEHIWFNFAFDGLRTNMLIWEFVSRYSIDGLISE